MLNLSASARQSTIWFQDHTPRPSTLHATIFRDAGISGALTETLEKNVDLTRVFHYVIRTEYRFRSRIGRLVSREWEPPAAGGPPVPSDLYRQDLTAGYPHGGHGAERLTPKGPKGLHTCSYKAND